MSEKAGPSVRYFIGTTGCKERHDDRDDVMGMSLEIKKVPVRQETFFAETFFAGFLPEATYAHTLGH